MMLITDSTKLLLAVKLLFYQAPISCEIAICGDAHLVPPPKQQQICNRVAATHLPALFYLVICS